jgi:hypothetical protein
MIIVNKKKFEKLGGNKSSIGPLGGLDSLLGLVVGYHIGLWDPKFFFLGGPITMLKGLKGDGFVNEGESTWRMIIQPKLLSVW